MNAIHVEGLGVRYGRKEVLRDLSFSVRPGEFLVVIGPNGSGKTSLLKALSGLVPSTGRVEVCGKGLADWSRRELARRVAVVPQHVPDDFPFRVAETVLMGRSPHLALWESEGERDRALAEEAMRFTDVAHLADRRLDRLSGGERQLVFIARAICQAPEILLLDEPTAALDPGHQVEILDRVEDLRTRRGVTVVMISHDLNLAALYGDRLLLMSEGRIAGLGAPDEVLTVERLERIYGCPMRVDRSPLGARPRVTPVPERFRPGRHGEHPPPGSG